MTRFSGPIFSGQKSALLAFGLLFTLALVGCSHGAGSTDSGKTQSFTKLETTDTVQGTGPAAADGDLLNVMYTGTLTDGTVFDSNWSDDPNGGAKPPFGLVLGAGTVIKGWDQGLVGMKVGGIREIKIPSDLAYGPAAQGKIPANSSLIFKVKLLALVKKGQEAVFDTKDVTPGTGTPVKDGDKVTINFNVKLSNGSEINSSDKIGSLTFQVPSGKINENQKMPVKGLCYGIIGMKKGGERIITVPPAIGFTGMMPEKVTPTDVLTFDVKLLNINPGK